MSVNNSRSDRVEADIFAREAQETVSDAPLVMAGMEAGTPAIGLAASDAVLCYDNLQSLFDSAHSPAQWPLACSSEKPRRFATQLAAAPLDPFSSNLMLRLSPGWGVFYWTKVAVNFVLVCAITCIYQRIPDTIV
jgi:hypothetical protein